MAREKFSSTLGSLLVLAGSAVGLGNIWRFPYMLGEYGGGAFILIYLVCMMLVSMPILLVEILIGRRSQKTAYGSLGVIDRDGKVWKNFGSLFVLIPTITVSYYSVIGGWTVKYFIDSCALKFTADSSALEITGVFGDFVSSPWAPMIYHLVFLLAVCVIIALGVKKGIEQFSKVMMPMLFVIMLLLAIRSMTIPAQPGISQTAAQGVRYLFVPDFSKVGASTFAAALGQAFFSLSIGMGIMLTYGSYLPKKDNLAKTAAYTSVFDLIFAVIAGCAVIPAMFAYGMYSNPEMAVNGPGLVYKTLPVVFSQMPLGSVVAIFFFFAVILAALTSAMSLFEVPVSWLVETGRMKRPAACVTVFVLTYVIGLVCSLSFGVLSGFTIKDMNFFDALDHVTANFLMPLAGFVVVLFAGWKMKKSDIMDELTNGGELKGLAKAFPVIYVLIRYVAPIGVLAVFLSSIFGN
ncbi:MAG: sodium-dependent transporter [Bacteroidales bacterium]|nr:sodium-dependent transporter [Candidatus Cryptobacteroides caccocaballi]